MTATLTRTSGVARRPRVVGVLDVAALTFLALLVVAIAIPGVLSPYDPLAAAPGQTLQAPSLTHPFGTDYLGRDLFSRVMHGTSRTLLASTIAVSIGLGVGTLLGLFSAYFGRGVDAVISRIVDVLLSIPGLLLSMMIVVALGFGAVNAAIAVGIASVATFARLMRSEVLRVKALTFVESSRHLGVGPASLLFRHVLPNSWGPVLSMTTLQFGSSILAIAALSFLGYGAPPPQPEWGMLVSEGREYLASSPWLTLLPGLVIILTVLSVSRLSKLITAARTGVRS
ncbi:ABC transporter permease [Microbacterium sorbitolivorans]|uniref:ABC transporter permease n=1 Tax=Microbacterium sorbitolivorans TaxID=1867410 RepID=A0A367XXX8_9MICO|nr:ABC transporter permease [Microbacterium sorbitolivorans]RCK58477.1 ABC transporter permease [Microbacterium sorbitolivorans]GGF36848.1 ABC transporter permease [Microbacterium sorbitolivorans]